MNVRKIKISNCVVITPMWSPGPQRDFHPVEIGIDAVPSALDPKAGAILKVGLLAIGCALFLVTVM